MYLKLLKVLNMAASLPNRSSLISSSSITARIPSIIMILQKPSTSPTVNGFNSRVESAKGNLVRIASAPAK